MEDGDRFEAALEKRAPRSIFSVGHFRQGFLEAIHEPSQIGQPFASPSNPPGVGAFFLDPSLRHGQRFSLLAARRIQPSPAFGHLLVGPLFEQILALQPHDEVKMVVKH